MPGRSQRRSFRGTGLSLGRGRTAGVRAALLTLGLLTFLSLVAGLQSTTNRGGVHARGYLASLAVSVPLAVSLLGVLVMCAFIAGRPAGRLLVGVTFLAFVVVGLLELQGLAGNATSRVESPVELFDAAFFAVVTITGLIGLTMAGKRPSVR